MHDARHGFELVGVPSLVTKLQGKAVVKLSSRTFAVAAGFVEVGDEVVTTCAMTPYVLRVTGNVKDGVKTYKLVGMAYVDSVMDLGKDEFLSRHGGAKRRR